MVLPTNNLPQGDNSIGFLDAFRIMASYISLTSYDDPRTPTGFHPVSTIDHKAIEKLLLNAWSAEYALRITPVVNDEVYLQSALHWTFPQAYYSVLFSARAFLAVQGSCSSNEDEVRKQIGGRVVGGFYPEGIGYYAYGSTGNFRIHRLSKNVPLLSDLLLETRTRRIEQAFRAEQMNPKTLLRCPQSGDLLRSLTPKASHEIVKRIGFTTYFDLISRLRISSRDRDIERLYLGHTDVNRFHANLLSIVEYISGIHELYVATALGAEAYAKIIAQMPVYLGSGVAGQRATRIIDRLEKAS